MVVRSSVGASLVASLTLLSCSSPPSPGADSSVSGGSPAFMSGGAETVVAGSAPFASGGGGGTGGGQVTAGRTGASGASTTSDWYDDSFTHRRLVTPDPSLGTEDEALCDFPAPLVLPANTFAPGTVRADGADLRFVDATGEVLSHELEVWNPTGESLVWVRFPKLPVPAVVYMYYGSPDETAVVGAETVWKPPYAAVWHFAGDAKDASPQRQDGAVVHAAFAAGKLGQAAKFVAAAQDHIGLAHGSSLIAGAETVTESAWVHSGTVDTASYGVVLGVGSASTTGHLSRTSLMVWGSAANYPYGGQPLHDALYAEINPDEADGGWSFGTSPMEAVTPNAWHYLTITYGVLAKAVTLYVDGKLVGGPQVFPGKGSAAPATGAWSADAFAATASDRVEIGAEEDISHGFFDGLIDELRVETDARTPSWIAAQAAVAAGTAISIGPEQQH